MGHLRCLQGVVVDVRHLYQPTGMQYLRWTSVVYLWVTSDSTLRYCAFSEITLSMPIAPEAPLGDLQSFNRIASPSEGVLRV